MDPFLIGFFDQHHAIGIEGPGDFVELRTEIADAPQQLDVLSMQSVAERPDPTGFDLGQKRPVIEPPGFDPDVERRGTVSRLARQQVTSSDLVAKLLTVDPPDEIRVERIQALLVDENLPMPEGSPGRTQGWMEVLADRTLRDFVPDGLDELLLGRPARRSQSQERDALQRSAQAKSELPLTTGS